MSDELIISAKNVTKSFSLGGNKHHIAVNDVSLDMYKGETLALVGESGCGKSTLAKLLMRLIKADSGEIIFDGIDISSLSERLSALTEKECRWSFRIRPHHLIHV